MSKKRTTWTFEPTAEVSSLLSKQMTKLVGRGGNRRGLRTRLINEVLSQAFKSNFGKRESA